MDQRWSKVPEQGLAMSPVRSLMSMAASGALCPVNWRIKVKREIQPIRSLPSPDTRISSLGTSPGNQMLGPSQPALETNKIE
jgi:hypothetical protein